MSVAESLWRNGCKPSQAVLGWIFAMLIVPVALFIPVLTDQQIPTLTAVRHDILMTDREFERWSMRTDVSFTEGSTFELDSLKRPECRRLKTQLRGDVS